MKIVKICSYSISAQHYSNCEQTLYVTMRVVDHYHYRFRDVTLY